MFETGSEKFRRSEVFVITNVDDFVVQIGLIQNLSVHKLGHCNLGKGQQN